MADDSVHGFWWGREAMKPGYDNWRNHVERIMFRHALALCAKGYACRQLRTGPVSMWTYLERG